MTNASESSSLSIVVPAYNEENTLRLVVEKLLLLPMLLEVVVVDDGSTDGTPEIADRLAVAHTRVRVIHQENEGKTSAVKRGIQETRGNIVVIQDADTEYDSSEIPALVQPIEAGVADVVYGSRFLVRKAARVLYFYHYIANTCITFLSNLFTNINLSDVETGYKAFRGEIIRRMVINSTGSALKLR